MPVVLVAACGGDRPRGGVPSQEAGSAAHPCDIDTPEVVRSEGGLNAADYLALQREVCIDGHAHDLVHINAATRLPDGTLAVLQRTRGQVLFFSTDGALKGTFGGQGQGPGEFQNPTRAGRLGDTLWVHDARAGRFTFVDAGRELIRTQTAPAVGAVELFQLRDGAILAGIPEPDRGTTRVVRADDSGRTVHEFGRLPPRDISSVGQSAAIPPLPNDPVWRVSPDGRWVALAVAHMEGNDQGSIALSVHSHAGELVFEGALPFDWEPIPRAEADRILSERERLARQATAGADQRAARMAAARLPPAYPPLADAVLGEDGSLWIRGYGALGRRGYLRITPDGEQAGWAPLSRASRVLAAGDLWLWVAETDQLGVPSLVRYRIDAGADG